MITKECQPPEPIHLNDRDFAVFLAGPIQGSPDWQRSTVEIFRQLPNDEDIHILNPRRNTLGRAFNYEEQVAWEKIGLRRASKFGAIIFWFAKRDMKLPYETGRAYAQTTRIEFGRVLGWLDSDPFIDVSIGIEPGYRGSENYINTCAKEFNLPVFETLEETCAYSISNI
jgi:hypothetical protein